MAAAKPLFCVPGENVEGFHQRRRRPAANQPCMHATPGLHGALKLPHGGDRRYTPERQTVMEVRTRLVVIPTSHPLAYLVEEEDRPTDEGGSPHTPADPKTTDRHPLAWLLLKEKRAEKIKRRYAKYVRQTTIEGHTAPVDPSTTTTRLVGWLKEK